MQATLVLGTLPPPVALKLRIKSHHGAQNEGTGAACSAEGGWQPRDQRGAHSGMLMGWGERRETRDSAAQLTAVATEPPNATLGGIVCRSRKNALRWRLSQGGARRAHIPTDLTQGVGDAQTKHKLPRVRGKAREANVIAQARAGGQQRSHAADAGDGARESLLHGCKCLGSAWCEARTLAEEDPVLQTYAT